jgi:hypothetical protein
MAEMFMRLTTGWLDKPRPCLSCSETAKPEETLIAEIIDLFRSFRMSNEGRNFVFRDARGRRIEGFRYP